MMTPKDCALTGSVGQMTTIKVAMKTNMIFVNTNDNQSI